MHAYDHAKTKIMTTMYIIEIHVLEHVTFMYEANSFFLYHDMLFFKGRNRLVSFKSGQNKLKCIYLYRWKIISK